MTWTQDDLRCLLGGDAGQWERLLSELEGLAQGTGLRLSLTPAEVDEVRGELVLRLLHRQMRMIRACRDPCQFHACLRRVALRVGSRILSRAPPCRPRLVGDVLKDCPLRPVHNPPSLQGGAIQTPLPLEHLLEQIRPRITPLQWEVLHHRTVRSSSWAEIAGALGRTRDAVRKAYGRALARLARRASFRPESRPPPTTI